MKTHFWGEIDLTQTTSQLVENPPRYWQCVVCGGQHLLSAPNEAAYSVTVFGRGGGYCHIDCRPPTRDEQEIAAEMEGTGQWVRGDSRALENYLGA